LANCGFAQVKTVRFYFILTQKAACNSSAAEAKVPRCRCYPHVLTT